MRRHRGLLLLAAGAALVMLAAGCGDDDGDACHAAFQKLCDRACECTDGPACALTDATGSGTLTFDSPSDCEGLYLGLGCGGSGSTTIDFAACSAALDSAMCIDTSSGRGLVNPEACNEMMGGGP